MHARKRWGPRMVEHKEVGLVQEPPSIAGVSMLISWTLGLSVTHTDSRLRETHTELVGRGGCS